MTANIASHGIPGVPELVSRAQIKKLTGWSDMTITRRLHDGDLVGYRLGPRDVRITLESVLALLKPLDEAPRWETPLTRALGRPGAA
jgi:hypothetical protein